MDARKAQKLVELQRMIDSVPSTFEDDGSFDIEGAVETGCSGRKQQHREGIADDVCRKPPKKSAFQRIVELCGYHDFCCAKMHERLKREGIPEDAVAAAIDKAVRIGLIDDLRWGEMRASALMRKGVGSIAIVRELKENGISATDIDGWPHEYEERFGSEIDRALVVLEKNPPRSKNPRASAYGRLVRKGYAASVASEATNRWFASLEQ